jgi:hypothetical protein
VSVELRFVSDDPTRPAVEVWLLSASLGGSGRNWLIERVKALGLAQPTSVEGQPADDAGEPFYVLRVREPGPVAGPSPGTVQILVDLSVSLLSAAAWDGIKALRKDIARRVRDRDDMSAAQPLTEQEAIERARWNLSTRYHVSGSDLRLHSIDMRPAEGAAVVELADHEGGLYSCEWVTEDGLVLLARLVRKPPPIRSE